MKKYKLYKEEPPTNKNLIRAVLYGDPEYVCDAIKVGFLKDPKKARAVLSFAAASRINNGIRFLKGYSDCVDENGKIINVHEAFNIKMLGEKGIDNAVKDIQKVAAKYAINLERFNLDGILISAYNGNNRLQNIDVINQLPVRNEYDVFNIFPVRKEYHCISSDTNVD
ncbi:hypothetical protein ACFL1H_03710 [Nanoarchaeota archaeon]